MKLEERTPADLAVAEAVPVVVVVPEPLPLPLPVVAEDVVRPAQVKEVDRTRLREIGHVKADAVVAMLTPPRTVVNAGSSTVWNEPSMVTAWTVVRAGKLMSLMRLLFAIVRPATDVNFGIVMFVSAVLLVIARSPVILVRLFA